MILPHIITGLLNNIYYFHLDGQKFRAIIEKNTNLKLDNNYDSSIEKILL